MTVTHTGTDAPHEGAADEHHDHHPSDALYWKVGAVLGILTLLEVSTYFIADPPYDHELGYVLIGGLLALMVIKFVVIAGYFMHLKFDNKVFRNVFVAGLVLAVIVYLVVLSVFTFFDDNYEAALTLLS